MCFRAMMKFRSRKDLRRRLEGENQASRSGLVHLRQRLADIGQKTCCPETEKSS